jgi:Ca2+:H+ antiporter
LRVLAVNDLLVFVTSAVAIVPLAGLIGSATDEAAKYLGAGVGGFLSATFGNAAELIIVLLALQRGLTEVVKASLTGSILGNLLLVLGLAMFVGGWGRDRQTFNRTNVGAAARTRATSPSPYRHARPDRRRLADARHLRRDSR